MSDLLIKNSDLHPGLAHYDEMEPYYRALPREQVLTSPALMSGMSMLSSICMDYEGSEAWYQELRNYAAKLKRSDPEYKSVRGRLAYLDIGLPQRSVNDFKTMLPSLITLLTNREIVLPEFSVTSRLPSIMNGGKDFCEWSKEDSDLYRKYRVPVSLLLGRDGVKLPECAIAESKFEKGEDVSGRVLDLMACLDVIQKKGTPDIEFALIGLLTRLRIDQGEADHAREHLESLRERFQRPECLRFLPNLDALLCRVAMYEGDETAVDVWYKEKAPKDLLKLRVMLRYQYLTRAMVEIAYGNYQEALLVMAPLRPYFTACRRVMDLIYLDLLTAICRFRSGDSGWKTPLANALDTCWAFAVEGEPDTGLCDHHPEHIGCGYTAPTEGHPCGHRHTAECYTQGVLPDTDGNDPYEVGTDTENLLDCHHSHDSECGYVQANPGTPCGYECRICPIEDLIAALPDAVTEDNEADVRGQLDKILALYGELNEDEQEEIDLSRIYALQGALDTANAPMPVPTGEVVLSRGQIVTFTEGECGSSCQGHRITQADSASTVGATYIYVASGEHNVTFSGLNLTGANVGVMPGGTMHLTIEGSNSIRTTNVAGIYVPKTAALAIGGTGSLTVQSRSSTGIGGSLFAPNGTAGDLDCGTVVIDSGTVTVIGGGTDAGIGGACKESTEPGGNGGEVIINGGEVAVTGGDDNWGGPAIGSPIGRPVGYIGTLTINGGHVTLTATSHGKPSGFGSSDTDTPSAGPNKMTLASADYLTLTDGTILDPRASYEIMGNPLTMDLITVPEGLVYTGEDLTDTAKSKISLGSEGAGTRSLFGVDFTVITDTTDWTYTITPAQVKEAGEYTVTYAKGSDKVTKTFTVAGVTASLGEIETYNGDSKAYGFGVGDTITVKIPAPTLEPPLADTSGLKMAVYCGSTQVSQPAAASPDGSYTMEVSTNELVRLLNLDFSNETAENVVTLTAKYLGNSSVSSAEASVRVGIYAYAMIAKGGEVGYVGRNWADLFKESGNDGAAVTLLGSEHSPKPNLDIQINCTLNLNSRTISAKETEYAIYVAPNCQVTVQGPGEVIGNPALVVAGDVTLNDATFLGMSNDEYTECAVSVVSGGKLSVTGDAKIGHPVYGLEVKDGATVRLSSGTYDGGAAAIKISAGNMTLADLLAEGYAYYRDSTPILLSELEGQAELTGTVTVKECNHTGEGVCI